MVLRSLAIICELAHRREATIPISLGGASVGSNVFFNTLCLKESQFVLLVYGRLAGFKVGVDLDLFFLGFQVALLLLTQLIHDVAMRHSRGSALWLVCSHVLQLLVVCFDLDFDSHLVWSFYFEDCGFSSTSPQLNIASFGLDFQTRSSIRPRILISIALFMLFSLRAPAFYQ